MKRFLLSLFAFFMFATTLMAQQPPVVNGIMQGSPRTFMVNPATCTQNGWARPYYYSTCVNDNSPTTDPCNTFGVWSPSPGSHRLLTRTPAQIAANVNPEDNNACMGPQAPNTYLPIFPPAWDSDIHPGTFEDTVMQIGAGNSSYSGTAQKMEYYFIPDTNNPVLLVQYECVLQAPGHSWSQNPIVLIQVSPANSNTPLNLGYYPNDYISNGNAHLGTVANNTNWPYSRYYFIANRDADEGTYPSPNYMTPSRWYSNNGFTIYKCGNGYDAVKSTQYVTVAFNLTEQARSHTAVKFKIMLKGCTPCGHWSYMYFTAKMVPGKINPIACGDAVDFEVPFGFNANSYQWERGLNDTMTEGFTPANNYRFSVPANIVYPYYRCKMESETGVPFTYEAFVSMYDLHADFKYEEIGGNCDHTVLLEDTSIIYSIVPAFRTTPPDTTRLNVTKWEWFKRVGTSWNLVAQDTGKVQLTYGRDVDSAQVMLVINQPGTECRDTITKWLHFDPDFVNCPTTNDTIRICESAMVNGSYTQTIADSLYKWEYDRQVIPVVYKAAAWNNCDSTVRTILMVERPVVEISSTKDYCENFETTLKTDKEGGDYVYEWSTGETTPTIDIDRAGTYTVRVTDAAGCVSFDDIIIPTCKPFMNLANAITPSFSGKAGDHSADNANDCFSIPQWNLIKEVEFTVFTRTGQLVYHYKGDPKNLRWCGTYQDTDKPVEYNVVYPYVLKYTDLDNISKVIKSTITVL